MDDFAVYMPCIRTVTCINFGCIFDHQLGELCEIKSNDTNTNILVFSEFVDVVTIKTHTRK